MREVRADTLPGAALVGLPVLALSATLSFPWLELSPESPVQGDTVALRVVLGQVDSGSTPSYAGLTYAVSPDSAVAGLPGYAVRLAYTVSPVASGSGSRFHGPTFRIPSLPLGHYRVVDSVSGVDLATFRVLSPGTISYTLSGTVVDAAPMHEPIAGAVVVVEEPAVPYTLLRKSLGVAAAQVAYRFVGMARSDSAGRFVMGNLTGGIYSMSATAPDHDSVWLQARVDRDISVTLGMAARGTVGSVAGTVRLPACPLDTTCGFVPTPPCTVRVTASVPDTAQYSWTGYMDVYDTALTDSNGSFSLDSIPASSARACSVTAWGGGLQQRSVATRVLPSCTAHVCLTLERRFAYTATVTHDSIDYVLGADSPAFSDSTEYFLVSYWVHNRSAREVTYHFDSTCSWGGFCGFRIVALETWSRDTLAGYVFTARCTPTPKTVTVSPGDTASFGVLRVSSTGEVPSCTIRAWLRGFGDTTAVELVVRFESGNGVVRPPPRNARASHAVLRGNRLVLEPARAQQLRVALFTLDGRAVLPPVSWRLPTGLRIVSVETADGRVLTQRWLGK